jgi:hypothetical protein
MASPQKIGSGGTVKFPALSAIWGSHFFGGMMHGSA